VKDPTSPPSGYQVFTSKYYTSPQLADELLGMNMVTTGTVMPSRRKWEKRQGDVLSFRKNGETIAQS
jgi:hypothetical protein